MFHGLRRSGLAALVLAAVALVAAAPAQEASTTAEVRDQAQFFSSLAESQAEARLADLYAKHNVRVVIETTPEVPSDKADAVRSMTAAQRQTFFSDWTRQKAVLASEPDVYVLINREPSHLRVRTSPALRQRGYSDSEGRALTNAFLSGFRQKQCDAALRKSVDLLESHVGDLRADRSTPTAAGPVESDNDDATSSWFSGSGLITVIAIVGLGLLVMVVLSTVFRSMSGGGYGGPGYGGGGFLGSLLGTIGGVMAGSWLYDHFFNNSAHASDATPHDSGATADDHTTEAGDYGGDFGGDDWGGGGDDFGGGDFGGGDF
jgi:uncharacterized protein